MPIFGERPHTSITVKINQLAKPSNEDIDDTIELYLSDLLDLISIQPGVGGPEAARAIRKKVKHGDTVDEQIRALNILELLVLNSGPKIGPSLTKDDKLIDVLKGILTGHGKTGVGLPYDDEVRQKVRNLAIGWKSELDGLQGYKYFQMLWQYIPRKKEHHHRRNKSTNVFESHEDKLKKPQRLTPSPEAAVADKFRSPKARDNDDDYDYDSDGYRSKAKSPPPRPKTLSPYTKPRKEKNKKNKKSRSKMSKYADSEYGIAQINYKVEAPKIIKVLAVSQTHATALNNILISLPPDTSPLDDERASKEFEKIKSIRRKVLRYLQYVGAGDPTNKTEEIRMMDERFLGTLLDTNESLVATLKRFDAKCGYTDADPAPTYNDFDEEDSDESYYTDESSDEGYMELVSERLQNATIGSSSKSSPPLGHRSPPPPVQRSPPPPRPSKPAALSLLPPKPLTQTNTNSSVESDPFGDSSAVTKSVYD